MLFLSRHWFFNEEIIIKKNNTNGIEIIKYLDTYLYSLLDFLILSNTPTGKRASVDMLHFF